jgi:hypothetical protein
MSVVTLDGFFSAQGIARQNLKRCPELSRNKLPEYVFNISTLSLARLATENIRKLHFVKSGGDGC